MASKPKGKDTPKDIDKARRPRKSDKGDTYGTRGSPSSSSLKFIIMNTGGKNTGEKPTERRKQAIFDVISKSESSLVLLQEFGWTSIRSRAWNEFKWPDNLHYKGHKDASIIFDINEVVVVQYSQKLLESTLEELVRIGKIQQGFTPIPRMCLLNVKTKGVPIVEFICVSWHGRHNKAKLEDLKAEFKYLLEYIMKLSEKESLPFVIAGDFNVKIKDIEKLIPSSLALHRYTPTKRRDEESVIDFYISSKSLSMSDVKTLDVKTETKVEGVLSLFDHDPVMASLSTA